MKTNNDVTHVTHVTPVTDVTHVTDGCVTSVTCNKHLFNSVFEANLSEQILKFLIEQKKPFTYAEIAKNLRESEAVVRVSISRKKEFFAVSKPDGKKAVTHVTEFALEEIRNRMNKKLKELEFQELIKNTKAREKQNEEELFMSFKKLAKNYLNLSRNGKTLTIDFKELLEYDSRIADYLLEKPEEFKNKFLGFFEEKYHLNFINLPKTCNSTIQDLRKNHLGKLAVVIGRVVSLSDVRPQSINAEFECPSCGTIISVLQIEKRFREPKRCSCGRKGQFKLLSKEMVDAALIKLEDLPERTDNPHTQKIRGFIEGDLTSLENIKMFAPGNEVKVTGIVKEIPIQLNGGGISTRFDLYFEIFSAQLSEEEVNVQKISKEELREIQELTTKIDREGLNALIPSFCPEIQGHEAVKSAIILQLCNQKNMGRNERNKPNILLIGDPGMAKSVLGKFAVRITPGSQKAVGGSSSAVGITASIEREEKEYGGWRIEPGALVIAKDLLFLDELNNLSDEDKPRLQEGLSEQSVTVNKASIHTSMRVTAGVLSAANPVHGHFDPSQDITKQFNLTSPILNRQDTIFVMRDHADVERDKNIAKTMLQRTRGKINPEYSENFLRKFFVFIKQQPEPEIDDSTEEKLKDLYAQIRQESQLGLMVNARFLEALIRMLKACAKIRLSPKVEVKDIERCLEIMKKSHYSIQDYKYFKKHLK